MLRNDPDPFLVLTAAEAIDKDYIYIASCDSCHRSVEVDLRQMAADMPVRQIARRLRCRRCARRPVVTFLARAYYLQYFQRQERD